MPYGNSIPLKNAGRVMEQFVKIVVPRGTQSPNAAFGGALAGKMPFHIISISSPVFIRKQFGWQFFLRSNADEATVVKISKCYFYFLCRIDLSKEEGCWGYSLWMEEVVYATNSLWRK